MHRKCPCYSLSEVFLCDVYQKQWDYWHNETYVLSYNAVQCIVQLEIFGRRDFHFLFSKIKIQSTCENKVFIHVSLNHCIVILKCYRQK